MNPTVNAENVHGFFFGLNVNVMVGASKAERLGQILSDRNLKSVILIYDKNASETGLATRIMKTLVEAEIDYTEHLVVDPVTTDESVDVGIRRCRGDHLAAIVVLGDGRTVNYAKAVNIVLGNAGPLARFYGVNKVMSPGLPLIVLPLTIGIGSEITSLCVISDDGDSDDYVISGQNVAPTLTLVDPCLMRAVPFEGIAVDGMDALARAIEAYLTDNASPFSDALAVCAIKLITDNLEKAVVDTGDDDAWMALMAGGIAAGMAFSNTQSGKAPTPGYYLSKYLKLALAKANAIMLPYIMEYKLGLQAAKLKHLAFSMGLRVEKLSEADAAALAVKRVCEITKNIGGPSIKDVDVNEDFVLELISSSS